MSYRVNEFTIKFSQAKQRKVGYDQTEKKSGECARPKQVAVESHPLECNIDKHQRHYTDKGACYSQGFRFPKNKKGMANRKS
jgi:hypothetical protein